MKHRISTILPLAALAALVLNAAAQQRDAWADRPTQKPDEANIKDQLKDPYTRADRRVLLGLDLSDPDTGKVQGGRADKDYAIAWIRREGKGRVFYNSLGHDVNVFQVPGVLKFNLDGIQYALGDLPADDSPATP